MPDPVTLSAIIAGGFKLANKFVRDEDQKEEFAHEFGTLVENNQAEIQRLQIKVNESESQHRSIWVAGWRPFIGWTCGAAIFNNYIFVPYVTAFSDLPIPALDVGALMPLITGLLGLGAFRTYEKVKGKAK